MPKVSVIIPSYNHERYVSLAIQSVLDQTYQDFEIVITDDGSSDSTVDEIKRFKDPRIRLFCFEKNQGAAVASRNCISNAKGEYFAMLNSDDIFMPDKLEKQVRFLDEHRNVSAVFGYAQIIDDSGNNFQNASHFYSRIFYQQNRTRFQWLNRFFFHGNCLCHPSVLARREVYTTIGPPDRRYSQLGDFYRWISVCLKHDIYIIPEYLVKFRVREGEKNASGNRLDSRIRCLWEYAEILKCFLDIETTSEFLKIFPEAKKYEDKIEDDLIPFFVAMLALEQPSQSHQLFGMQTLYQLLDNSNFAKKLSDKCGFRYIDFIKLSGNHDTFNIYTTHEQNKIINGLESDIRGYEEKFQQISGRLNKMSSALPALEKVTERMEKEGISSDLSVETGNLCYSFELYDKARYFYEKALSLKPENTDAAKTLGILKLQMGDYKAAADYFEKILKLNPSNKDALKLIGEANQALGNLEEAEKAYSKLISIEDSAENLFSLALVQKELKKFKPAVQNLEKAKSMVSGPEGVEVYLTLADCYTGLEKYEQGTDFYNLAMKFNGKNERPYVGRGVIELQKKNIDDARRWFNKALELNSRSHKAICGLGMIACGKGDKETGFKKFMEALDINVEDLTALALLIQVSYELGKLSEAEPYLKEYLDLHPADMDVLYKHAEVCYRLGYKDKAMESLDKILIFAPEREDALNLKEKIKR